MRLFSCDFAPLNAHEQRAVVDRLHEILTAKYSNSGELGRR